jgi:NADH-quinone oxidoreductase subunit C
LKSTSSVFANANWLEREVSEMSGIVFEGKHDLRNLLLSYGDSSAPLRKANPSVGFKEITYDINNDMLVQTPISLQI